MHCSCISARTVQVILLDKSAPIIEFLKQPGVDNAHKGMFENQPVWIWFQPNFGFQPIWGSFHLGFHQTMALHRFVLPVFGFWPIPFFLFLTPNSTKERGSILKHWGDSWQLLFLSHFFCPTLVSGLFWLLPYLVSDTFLFCPSLHFEQPRCLFSF